MCPALPTLVHDTTLDLLPIERYPRVISDFSCPLIQLPTKSFQVYLLNNSRIHSFSPVLENSALATVHHFLHQTPFLHSIPTALVLLPQVFAHGFSSPWKAYLNRCTLGHSLNCPSSAKPTVTHRQEWPQTPSPTTLSCTYTHCIMTICFHLGSELLESRFTHCYNPCTLLNRYSLNFLNGWMDELPKKAVHLWRASLKGNCFPDTSPSNVQITSWRWDSVWVFCMAHQLSCSGTSEWVQSNFCNVTLPSCQSLNNRMGGGCWIHLLAFKS